MKTEETSPAGNLTPRTPKDNKSTKDAELLEYFESKAEVNPKRTFIFADAVTPALEDMITPENELSVSREPSSERDVQYSGYSPQTPCAATSIIRQVGDLYKCKSHSIRHVQIEIDESIPLNDTTNQDKVFLQTRTASIWRKLNYFSTFSLSKHIPFIFHTILFNLGVFCVFLAGLKIIGKNDWVTGNEWFDTLPLSHWTLTTAWWFLCVSYYVTDIVTLRFLLAVACWFFTLFGIIGIPGAIGIDAIIYNLFMTIMNIWLGLNVVWSRRHMDFDLEFEIVYQEIFSLYLSRDQFQKLIDIVLVRNCREGELLFDAGDSVTDISIILDGSVDIIANGFPIVRLNRFDICEASEWISNHMNPVLAQHQFSARAVNNVKIMRWPRELLMKLLMESPDINPPILAILAIATTSMLYRLDTMNIAGKRRVKSGALSYRNFAREKSVTFDVHKGAHGASHPMHEHDMVLVTDEFSEVET